MDALPVWLVDLAHFSNRHMHHQNTEELGFPSKSSSSPPCLQTSSSSAPIFSFSFPPFKSSGVRGNLLSSRCFLPENTTWGTSHIHCALSLSNFNFPSELVFSSLRSYTWREVTSGTVHPNEESTMVGVAHPPGRADAWGYFTFGWTWKQGWSLTGKDCPLETHFLQLDPTSLVSPQTVPHSEDQVFKHMRSWEIFHIQRLPA